MRKVPSISGYELLAHGRWFCSGTPASSTTKTGRHDIAEILLIVALNTKNQSINLISNYWIAVLFWNTNKCIWKTIGDRKPLKYKRCAKIVCPSIYGFWLLLWYPQTILPYILMCRGLFVFNNLRWDWLIDFWCLTPLSAIFQLYHGDQFWQKKNFAEINNNF
jgi:hypothetical protein